MTKYAVVQAPAAPRPYNSPAQLQPLAIPSTVITEFEEEIWRTITIMDSFSFVTSGALEIPVNVKMSVVPHLLLSCSILTI